MAPRLLVAWSAGNSGTVAFFEPLDGVNGSLAIKAISGPSGQLLHGIFDHSTFYYGSTNPMVGVTISVELNDSAILTTPILGSIRTIREFTDGSSSLAPEVQNATTLTLQNDTAQFHRRWLDNETTTLMSFAPVNSTGSLSIVDDRLKLEAGTYLFSASFNYPQLEQLSTTHVLNNQSLSLINENGEQTQSLSFLSYSNKLLAGAWRYLTVSLGQGTLRFNFR